MGLALLLENMTTAMSVGLGCGTCCSTSISVFLSSYIMTHANSIKKTLMAFLSFFLGKVIAVDILCVIASLAGNRIIDKSGCILGINLKQCIRCGLIVLGIILIINWIIDDKKEKNGCNDCKGKCGNNISKESVKKWPTFVVGFIYGVTPCAPLILMMGYSTAMTSISAIIVGTVFSIASTLSPMLFMILLAGVLSKKMYDEIPKLIKYVKLACYVLFVIMAIMLKNQ